MCESSLFGGAFSQIDKLCPAANGAPSFGSNFHGVFISGNCNFGVMIIGAAATDNSVLSNSIYGSPGGLGIALGNDGVTAHDPRDPDSGPNRSFTIQFFSNLAPNIPTFFGEGES